MLVGYTVSMAKIIISLPDELLSKVDTYCTENEYNRSEFIRYSMRLVLEKRNIVQEVRVLSPNSGGSNGS